MRDTEILMVDPRLKVVAVSDLIRHRPVGTKTEATSSSWLPSSGPIAIGLTSGASTPDNLVGDVVLKLAQFTGCAF